MKLSNQQLAVIAVIVVVLVVVGFIVYRKEREEYTMTCLEGNCSGFNRTQVDYASNPQENPHWKAKPSSTRQPLDQGPVDLEADLRTLNNNDGMSFFQYRNDWTGCGKDGLTALDNDEKNRFDLGDNGELGLRRTLDSSYASAFGNKGFLNVEGTYARVGDASEITYTGDATAYGGSRMN